MKKWAVIAFCLTSSLASAKEIEEVLVVGRQFKIVLASIQQTHKQNLLTGNWYYVAELEEKIESLGKADDWYHVIDVNYIADEDEQSK